MMREVSRETSKVQRLEDFLSHLPQTDLPVEHLFAPGVYARVLHIPAGTVCTGKIHRHAHLNIIPKGEIEVHNQGETRRIKAPAYFVSEPGTKRAGYAISDTIWITIHPTEETDLEKIEAEVIVNSYEELTCETSNVLDCDKRSN